jgi:D-alanyl-lipoteichoic acid acyltransferase DltB (MBOAT superfamily)
MIFSSLIFVFYFLPAVLIAYFLTPAAWRNHVLLAASLLFYAYGEPRFVLVMLFSIVVNYLLAMAIHRLHESGLGNHALAVLWGDVLVNLSILFVLKYLAFATELANGMLGLNLVVYRFALPIGISFFTFQALSYVIDVYRREVPLQRNILTLALYIALFPQLVAGPIVRYSTIETQLKLRPYVLDDFAEGIRRFLLGFAKKVLLANNLAIVATGVFSSNVEAANPVMLWIGSICYMLQIFYDFSGYSDMAIGLGKMFGFHFEENFNYPYLSSSVTEFWRRWHISLGRWFRDYVYIPLGGGRVPFLRHIFNMFVVWTLTGIWHGANMTFVAWGLFYFVLLVVEKYLVHPERARPFVHGVLWRCIVLILINFGWVLFNSPTIGHALSFCSGMCGLTSAQWRLDSQVIDVLSEHGVFFVAGICFATDLPRRLANQICRISMFRWSSVVLPPLYYISLFLWSVSYLVLGSHNPFIYFNF